MSFLDQIDSVAKLDTVAFFYENPDTLDDAYSLAVWLGYETSELQPTLDALAEISVLYKMGDGPSAAYAFTMDQTIRSDIAGLVATYRTTRHAVLERLHKLEAQERRAQQQLKELRLSFEAIVKNIAEALIVTDPSGNLVMVNPAFARIFSVDENEAIGRRAEDLISEQSLIELLQESATGSAGELIREIVKDHPERRVFAAHSSTVKEDNERSLGTVTVLTDVTALKELSEMKSEFVSLVSHELRTPLTSIKGFINTLQSERAAQFTNETRHEFLGIVNAECSRLIRMLNEFLDISRIEAGKTLEVRRTSVNLATEVERVLGIQKQITARHQLIARLPAEIPSLQTDVDKLEQILTNLLSNAIKYSPNGGDVIVEVSVLDEEVEVAVTDYGIGIPPDQISNLFQKYHRVDSADARKIRGTGLGLFLVKHLVEILGGHIRVESEVGKGSTFRFILPKQAGVSENGHHG